MGGSGTVTLSQRYSQCQQMWTRDSEHVNNSQVKEYFITKTYIDGYEKIKTNINVCDSHSFKSIKLVAEDKSGDRLQDAIS